jgi:hypothetical protein
LWFATACILIRSIYRIFELKGGFVGGLAGNEALFMLLEGPLIILAVFSLTVLHPGLAFGGRSGWHAARWSLRGRKWVISSPQSEAKEPLTF